MRLPFSVSRLNTDLAPPLFPDIPYSQTRRFGRLRRPIRATTAMAMAVVSMLGLGLPLLGFITPQSAQASSGDWWNEDWRNRQVINVSHASDEDNVYHQFQLDTSNPDKFNVDCSDLRFATASGQLLPYHIVSGCGTADTQVQLLFSTLPAGEQDIYVYYGNPQASSMTSADDFNNAASGVTVNSTSAEQSSPAPIAYWKFDEGYGAVVNSSTSTNYPGSINGATWQTGNTCPSGKCLSFDGIDDNVEVAIDQQLGSGDFSLEAWIKPTHFNTIQNVVVLANSSSQQNGHTGSGIDVTNDNRYRFYARNTAGSLRAAYSSIIPATNQWDHLVGVRENLTILLYLNGKLTGTIASADMNYDQNPLLQIAKDNAVSSRDFFTGSLDNLKIYTYARTQQQIQRDYIRGMQALGQQQTGLSNGLIGHWKMDEASWSGVVDEVKDSSGNNRHMVSQSASVSSGKFGNGAQLDGSGDYLELEYTANQPMPNTISKSYWFNPTTFSGNPTLYSALSNYSGGGDDPDSYTHRRTTMRLNSSGQPSLFYSSYNCTGTGSLINYDFGTSTSAILNHWNNIVEVIDYTTSTVTIYLNGVSIANVSQSGYSCQSDEWYLWVGRHKGPGQVDFNGQIDDFRLYNRALTQAEVAQLYNFAPQPVAYYDFEEGSGSSIVDSSGSNLSAAWSGSGGRYAGGKVGKGGLFNGSDDYGAKASEGLLNPGSITLSAWVKLDAVAGIYQTFVGKWQPGIAQQYLLQLDTDDKFAFWTGDGGGGGSRLASTTTPVANQWYYLVGTQEGANKNLYVNGVLEASTNAATTLGASSIQFSIGSKWNGSGTYFEFLDGQLDDIKLYNYARTQGQIIQDMQASAAGVVNPVSHWKLSENQGVATTDSGPNQYQTTLSNTAWDADCQLDSCLSFNGTTSYAQTADFSLDSPAQLTTSFWAKPQSGGGSTPTFISDSSQLGNSGYLWIYRSGSDGHGIVYQYADGTNYRNLPFANAIIADEWHQYTFVADYTRAVTALYIDGKLHSSQTMTTPLAPDSDQLFFGRYNASHGSSMYSGLMDDIKFYKTALTSQQIAVDFNQSAAMVSGAPSTRPTIAGSGAAATKPANSTDSRYCVPGSTDFCAKPVAHYDFEEGSGSTINDISGNNNAGALFNDPARGQGKMGRAVQYDGVNDYIRVNNTSTLQNISTVSVSVWVNINEHRYGNFIVGKIDNFGYNGWLLNTDSAGRIRIWIGDSDSYYIYTSTKSLDLHKWHNISLTYSDANSLRVYVDGVSIDLVSPGKTMTQTPVNLYMGTVAWGPGVDGSNYKFSGSIDELKIYNYARTPAQVAWDYNYGKPLAHFKMDECQGSMIHDSSGNNLHGSLNLGASGITSLGTCNGSSSAWSLGKMGRYNASLSIDGVDDSILTAVDSVTIPANGTFAQWLKPHTDMVAPVGYPGLSRYATSVGMYIQQATGLPYIQVYINSANRACLSAQPITANEWQHIAGTYQAVGTDTRLEVFLNGKKVCSATWPGNVAPELSRIAINAATIFKGQIDDVQIFNYALTQKQIDVLYNGGTVRWGP